MMAGVDGSVGSALGTAFSGALNGIQQNTTDLFCEECGAQILPGAEFCDECGHPLNKGENTSPKCGCAFERPGKFCSKCGTKRG